MILYSKNLKKGKKWIYEVCLYSLALVLLPAILSFCFITEKTSALKHGFARMPLYTYEYFITDNYAFASGQDFWILQPDLDLDLSLTSAPKFFESLPSGNKCSWQYSGNYRSSGQWLYDYNSTLHFKSNVRYNRSNGSDLSSCNQNAPFGSGTLLPMNWRSIPGMYDDYRLDTQPYSFDYASYFYQDSIDVDGVVYNSSILNFSEIFGRSNVRQFTHPLEIRIPVGTIHDIQSDDFVDIVSGTTLDFSYELYLTELSSYDLSVSSSAQVTLGYSYIPSSDNFSTVYGSLSCSVSSLYDDYGLRFSWNCPFVSPEDIYENLIFFYFIISPGSGQSYIWDVVFDDSTENSGDISFFTKSLYVVTDGDDTPGGLIGGFSGGGNLSAAPGSAYQNVSSDNADWFSSLSNLFSFSIFNPFAPIFNLFTNGQSCASIPIIAGMLHAESDQYCSWFPLSVRNVLTPVFSLASVMLLFGFIVRWLGASSGNFFEDSKSQEVSNQGGRWGVFKRGGG